jgi:hypothetical protein
MIPRLVKGLALAAVVAACACAGPQPITAPMPPPPPPSSTPAKPLESVTIRISAQGFSLDSATSASFTIDSLRVYQGTRLTFTNQNTVAHDIQSGPPHLHTDCPEIGGAGFLVPGQTKSTDPLNRLVICTFHDHHYESDPRFSGRVTVEAR